MSEGPSGFIDTHFHVWDTDRLELPWFDEASGLRTVHLYEHFEPAAAAAGVEAAVYLEVDTTPAGLEVEYALVRELIERADTIVRAAVLGARLDAPGFAEWAARLAEHDWVAGVRQVLHVPERPRGTCLAPEFVANAQRLGEHRLLFEFCVRPDELEDAARLAEACPGTTFVLNHHGNPRVERGADDAWRRAIDAVAAQPNTVGKVSGLIQHVTDPGWTPESFAPFIHHVLDAFGPERVVWGSNWPLCDLRGTYGRWVEATLAAIADRPQQEQRALLSENARRIYRLG